MVHTFLFTASQFALSDQGVHLLRNGYNYQTLAWNEMKEIEIRSGMDMKNWLWVLVLGIALTAYGAYDIGQLIRMINDPNVHKIHFLRPVIPAIPLVLGIYSIVNAVRKTKVMIVSTGKKKFYLSLYDVLKADQYTRFVNDLSKMYAVNIME